MAIAIRHRVLDALAEDFHTAWVADPLAGHDHEALVWRGAPKAAVSVLEVPRPEASDLTIYVLPLDVHLRLHEAVEPLRDKIDRQLLPSVCGYRRGAQADEPYQREHQRFLDFVGAGCQDHRYLLRVDIARFFSNLSAEVVRAACLNVVQRSRIGPLNKLFDELSQQGVKGVPPGYADARLLTNAVLDTVDRSIDTPFARWVDDYRLFLDSPSQVNHVIQRMEAALHPLGLDINWKKTQLFDLRSQGSEILRQPLESVYHPEIEPPKATRAELRRVFVNGSQDPLRRRRELRFALRRMAQIGDPVAIPYALSALKELPWELPRLATYLGAFVSHPDVSIGILSDLKLALAKHDNWRVARLSPLAMRTRGATQITELIGAFLRNTNNAAVWALSVRLYARAAGPYELRGVLEDKVLEPRAALAACYDAQLDPMPWLIELAPATAELLATSKAPMPEFLSLL